MTTSNNPIRCPKCQGELAEDSNFCPDCGEPLEAVVFADKNLEAAVRVELGIPEGTLTRENLKRLDKLRTFNEGTSFHFEYIIKDLLGLEHAVNLTEVNIIHGQISDLSPLSLLTNLTFLGLPSNIISDISPLASLTNLKDGLGLSDNQITDISPLASLPKLTLRLCSGIWWTPIPMRELKPYGPCNTPILPPEAGWCGVMEEPCGLGVPWGIRCNGGRREIHPLPHTNLGEQAA